MNQHLVRACVMMAGLAVPVTAAGQGIDAAGTRAAGMAGAFVAVVDDASAVYWNPGALATGSYFSLVVDRMEGRTATSRPAAGSRSGFLLALAAPALGLTYYRVRATTLTPPDLATAPVYLGRNVIRPGEVRLDSLVTHHVGATVVQSLTNTVAVGATLKLVRGTAAAGIVADTNRSVLLADAVDLRGRASSKFDADVGLLATARWFRAGLTVRNLTEPEFESGEDGHVLRLSRQARAGVSVRPVAGWVVALDVDLLRTPGPFGDSRDAAVGAEGRVARRAFVRGGVRFNTLGDASQGRAASASFGGTYALRAAVLLDAQVTAGSERSSRGWGVAARFVY